MKKAIILAAFIYSFHAAAQSATEIYLFDLKFDNASISLTNPVNISNHTGYDNQPYFLDDGSLLYVSAMDGQTEVMHYAQGETQQLTNTPGGEYSPTLMPDKIHFSTIVLEPDGRQLLWKYKLDGTEPEILVPELKIGYHAWANDHVLISFVLGSPNTLEMTDVSTMKSEVITYQVGRSLSRIPGTQKVSFIQMIEGNPSQIKSYDPESGKIVSLVQSLEGSQDYAWASNGTLFMGQGTKLYVWKEGDSFWRQIANLSEFGLTGITRMSINPAADQIAIVVDEPAK